MTLVRLDGILTSMNSFLKTGLGVSGAGLLVLAYNFFTMYSIVGKCPENVAVQPCQAYDHWMLLNKLGLVVWVAGLVLLVIGFVQWRRRARQ